MVSQGRRPGQRPGQNGLGWMYYQGHGVPQDDAQAIAWYRKAADQGNADAQNNLGSMYAPGPRRAAGRRTGDRLVSQGRRPGQRRRQNNLGSMYANGQGVPQDYEQAVAWYRKAADQGDADAQGVPRRDVSPTAKECRRTMSALICGSTWRRRTLDDATRQVAAKVRDDMRQVAVKARDERCRQDDARSDRRGAADWRASGCEHINLRLLRPNSVGWARVPYQGLAKAERLRSQ